jgi:DNA-binding winged helix-turn-helix (wHTH) protein
MQAQKEISFGQFRLDLTNECLWQGTRAISLRPKAFAVLRLLIDNPGRLVNKQQVLDAVWPGTFVGDAVLKDNIRQLREALDDDAASPLYIETSHRRGYRFIAKISGPTPIDSSTPPVTPVVPATPRHRLSTFATARPVLARESELSRMQDWLEQSFGGDRQLIFVTGEPGIGKTTVVDTFLEQALGVPGLRVVHGQCLEHYGAGEAYLPLLDGFTRLCRSAEGGPILDALRQHAPAWLAQMPSVLSPAERSQLQTQSGNTSRERMLREMAQAIETMALDAPMLVVLEDLHWSDFSTLELISHLARRRDPARLMIIGTYRPVDVILGEHPLKGVKRELQAHGLCRELPLGYLSESSIGDYLRIRFPHHQLPARLRRTIHQRTEGNPLFVVDLVEFLIDQKMIVRQNDIWRLDVDFFQIQREVPANLRQLIEKQIERLSSDERTVLEAASVAGMECSCVAIAAGLDQSLEWVEEHCEQLANRHHFLSPAWLVELPDGTITPRRRFVHVLYLDVPYRLMSPMRRSQIHQRIAERGVAIYGTRDGEIAAELAMHFEQSRDWPRALQYLLQAAQNAAARSAHHEAIDLANRGLEVVKLLPQTDEHAKREMKLRMILSASLMPIKGFASAEVEKINAPCRDLFWRHGPSPELFYMLWSQNFYQQFSGEMRPALEISYQLMQLAEGLNDGALIMEAHQSIAALLVLLGRCSEALEHIEKGSALYSTHHNHRYSTFGNFNSKVMFECFAALALLELGHPDLSAARLAAGLSLARELGHSHTLVTALHIAAQTHQLRGEASLAYGYAKEAMELADDYGFALWGLYGLIEFGWAEAELGNPTDGIEKMRRGLAEYEATGAKLRSPYFLALLADQLGKTGQVEEGLSTITRALVMAGETGEGYALRELHRIKGELFLKSADPRNASYVACEVATVF